MRRVYLLRHGDYHLSGPSKGSLTEKGIQEIRQAAREIRDEMAGLERVTIYHSPKDRAVNSAFEVADELDSHIDVNLRQRAQLDLKSYRVGQLIKNITCDAILIGHQPDIEEYLAKTGQARDVYTGHWVKLNLKEDQAA